jgi:membrane protease YdiL (CAAX protease family)
VAPVFCAEHRWGRVCLAGCRTAATRDCLRGAGLAGILWLLFHAAFCWEVLLTLVPITLLLPYVVQRRRSTWAGIVIHAGFGAMGFLVLALGLA